MKISARNMFKGEVKKVEDGAVNGVVHIDVNGVDITSVITTNAIADLGLKPGVKAGAVIKASDVILVTNCGGFKISARNTIPGKVKKVESGAVNGIVQLETKAGVITASITMAAIEDLRLKEGVDACAVIKASHVLVCAE